MEIFIYDCELYCEDCAGDAILKLRAEFPKRLTKAEKKEFDDIVNSSWDDNTEKEDKPQFCANGPECPHAIVLEDETLGGWLHNPLTLEGLKSIKETIRERKNSLWRYLEEWYRDQLGLKVVSGETARKQPATKTKRTTQPAFLRVFNGE